MKTAALKVSLDESIYRANQVQGAGLGAFIQRGRALTVASSVAYVNNVLDYSIANKSAHP
jgi:hypothetical protein